MSSIDPEKINKYYVGAQHLASAIARGTNAGSTHFTLEPAIYEAHNKVANGEADCAIVVQIVKVITRSKPPVEIIDV